MTAQLTILRGLPGGGKSMHAKRARPGTVIASADTFPGLYSVDSEGLTQLDVTLLDPAHGASMRTAIEGLQAGRHVIVDNTNLSAEEILPYVALAQAFRTECRIVTIPSDPEAAFGRQTHGVPYAVISNGETGEVRKTYTFGDVDTGENETVVGGYVSMIERFEAFEAPFHWDYLPWLRQLTLDGPGEDNEFADWLNGLIDPVG